MKTTSMALSLIVTSVVLPACGHKKKNRKDIIHAPDELLVKSPLTLAGNNPDERDESAFKRCIAGSGEDKGQGPCHLPYVAIPQGVSREEQVATILSNTLISHPWQAARFNDFLQNAQPALISMFSCTKGVVIASEIRPSFYHPLSAGIYLDAASVAVTAEEKGTVSIVPDYREANFDAIPLQFATFDTIPKEQPTEEESQRLKLESLLTHELAHACDFKAFDLTGKFLSDELPEAPQNAVYHMAKWLYSSDKTSKTKFEKFTPAEIGKSFEEGPIVDIYGYGNKFEHLAMIVQDQLAFEFNSNTRTDLLLDNPKDGKIRKLPIYWGMKGKFCQPDLFILGRKLTSRAVPLTMEYKKTQEECPTTVFPAGTPVYQALDIPENP